MKTRIILTLLYVVAAGLFFSSCKKDKKKSDSPCARFELTQKNTRQYNQPCGITLSKTGVMAVVEYNGFNEYGSLGTTSIWASYSDFTDNKAPVQTLQSRGAEAVTFDGQENLYVAETEFIAGIAIYKKVAQGNAVSYQYLRTIHGKVTGGFVNPRGIAFDDKGRLYVANDGNRNIVKIIDPLNDGPQQIIASDVGDVKGLAIKGTDMYVTIYSQDVVFKATLKPNGDFGEITNTFQVTKPVDIAIKDDRLAISSPETGIITLIDPAQITKASEPFTGCKKEITVGNRLFGLAFNPLTAQLFTAHLGQNRVLTYE